jgi:hypothetical protein
MRKAVIALIVAVVGTTWWVSAAPRPEIEIAPSITIDRSTAAAIAAVDRSADFVATLQQFSSSVPKFDDAVFLDHGATAFVTATDGRIWHLNVTSHFAEPFVDAPLIRRSWRFAKPGDDEPFKVPAT